MLLLLIVFVLHWPLFSSSPLHLDTEQTGILTNQPTSLVMWHMPRHARHVALTFDDGPDHIITPQLLAILKEKNVKATFFLVGHMISKFPHILHRIIADGHDVANHTWAHYRLDEMSRDQVALQLSTTTDILTQLNAPMQPYVRPPGGRFNNFLIHAAKQQRLTMVMWDVNAADYKRPDGSHPPPSSITSRVIRQVKPGSIVLMHNSPATVKALPTIIDTLHERNYSIGLLQW